MFKYLLNELYYCYEFELMKYKLSFFETEKDFLLEITSGAVLSFTNANYENSRKNILIERKEIFDAEKNKKFNKYYSNVNLYGEKYTLDDKKIDKIEKLVRSILPKLVDMSLLQTPDYIIKNGVDGVSSKINVKIGNLFVSVNSTYIESKYRKICRDFTEKVNEIITGR